MTKHKNLHKLFHDIYLRPESPGIRYKEGVLHKTTKPASVTWDTETDLVYDHIKQMRPPIFNITNYDYTVGGIVLEMLINNGLLNYLTRQTSKNIASLNKYFWNISACPYKPAFPPNEDMPREPKSSFEVYYIVSKFGKVHRITLTRYFSSISKPDIGMHAAIVNGKLLYIVDLNLKVTVQFPNDEVTNVKMPSQDSSCYYHPNFEIENEAFDISHSIAGNFIPSITSPRKFSVYVNNYMIASGKERGSEYSFIQKIIRIFRFIILLPSLPFVCIFMVGYLIFCRVFVLPCIATSKINKYWLPRGSYKHVVVDESKLSSLKGHAMV